MLPPHGEACANKGWWERNCDILRRERSVGGCLGERDVETMSRMMSCRTTVTYVTSHIDYVGVMRSTVPHPDPLLKKAGNPSNSSTSDPNKATCARNDDFYVKVVRDADSLQQY